MSVGWVPSFSDIGCTNRAKGSGRTWSSIATFGDDIKKIDREEKSTVTLYRRGSSTDSSKGLGTC